MGTTDLNIRQLSADRARRAGTDDIPGEDIVETRDGEIDDGPIPRWAALVWAPLLVFGIAVVLGVLYGVLQLLF
ncbi:MAG: hypothetical protein QNJ13_08680 [Paracoccaceae bacterium]|nr:hypothetical protein [Paracoccaceae bacterium]